MKQIELLAITALLMLAMTTTSSANDNVRQFGDYTVHYNTLTTDMLPAEVASAHGITRSRNRGLLNIAILRDEEHSDEARGEAARARVNAATITLTGRYRSVSMQEIMDGDAVYYIGTFPIRDEEVLDFQVNIEPRGTEQSYQLTFRKTFYVSE